jgi:hypothetical protein
MLPLDNKSEFQVVVDMPAGTPLEQTAAVLHELGGYLATVPEVTDYPSYAGTAAPINFNGLVAAALNDKDLAVTRAARAAAQLLRDQAAALWRPRVGLTATAGVASAESDSRGAQFSAPAFGTSSGVGFSTSVNGGAGRWSVTASQPCTTPNAVRSSSSSLRSRSTWPSWNGKPPRRP